jgi:peptidoglycan glycosyltransferase
MLSVKEDFRLFPLCLSMPELPNPPLDFLEALFAHPLWPRFGMAVRLLFHAGFALLLLRVGRQMRREARGAAPGYWPTVLTLCGGVFFAVLAVRQADWQLMGQRKEKFLAFMQRYDRREFNPAHRFRAGRILDRKGRTLAGSRVTEQGIRRVYPYGPLFSHVIGYNHPLYGMTGLEAAGRHRLMGGSLRTREDLAHFGASLIDREGHTEGPSLRSTLDVDLQLTAHTLLDGRRGAVVLMDVQSGDVLAMVSRPEFDPNRLHSRLFTGQVEGSPLLNRSLGGLYPPGSVFKVLVAAAALNQGFSGTLDTPADGFTTAPANPKIRDHDYYVARQAGREWRGHGRIGLAEALAKSSNVFFAQLGIQTGAEALTDAMDAAGMLSRFSVSERPEATLTQGAARLTPLSDARPYAIAQFSIGQGDLLVSPLHIVMISAAVARGGETVFPRIDSAQPVRTGRRLSSEEHAAALRWMMRRSVTEGTGRGADIPEITIAGKTGTAQTGGGRESHSWFTGFAPSDNPRWAFAVIVEHGGFGSRAAVPLARQLLQTGVREGWLDL